jgi:hypothetical protein
VGGDMELNRNQFFMLGLIILIIGLQLRFVQTFVLNERATQFLARRMQDTQLASANKMPSLIAASAPVAKKPISPPRWLGYSLISIGSVLVLHSLAMKKPGG